jgi:hypothetical protein
MAAIVLPPAALFVLIEAGFQISDALRKRPANAGTERGVNVYDPELLYRPRVLPNPGPKGNQKRVVILGDSLIRAREAAIWSTAQEDSPTKTQGFRRPSGSTQEYPAIPITGHWRI